MIQLLQLEEIRSLSEGFNLWRHLFTKGCSPQVIDALLAIPIPEERDNPNLTEALIKMQEEKPEELTEDWLDKIQADYTKVIFGPGKLDAYPFEAVAITGDRQLLQPRTYDVRKAYLDAGLAVERLDSMPDDYLGVEFEFVYLLLTRAANHLESGDLEKYQQDIARYNTFMQDHLLTWAPDFCLQAAISCKEPFVAAIFELVHHWLKDVGR